MSKNEFLNALNDDVIAKFKTAIELGKWPDGRALTQEQRDTCMRAVIMYEHEHLPEDQRTGYVPPKPTPCETNETETPIKWK